MPWLAAELLAERLSIGLARPHSVPRLDNGLLEPERTQLDRLHLVDLLHRVEDELGGIAIVSE